MAILEILTFPNPILRTKSESVSEFDSALKNLTEDMLETMYDAPGVGLAANQVGVTRRILVIDTDYDVQGDDESNRKLVKQNPRIFINPEIIEKTGSVLFKEGCLSVPGTYEEVKRFAKAKLKYQDIKGATHELAADGLLAVAIQHEIDHLEGRLFIDRLSEIKKSMIKNKLIKRRSKKFERSRFHVEL